MTAAGLRALVVDDEQPARDELAYLLGRDDRVVSVATAASGDEALERLGRSDVDLVFLDIAMPGLNGLAVASAIDRLEHPPAIVFVTAHDAHAVDAFELHATDYLLKPVREERLSESIRRVSEPLPGADDEKIAVELAGVTRFVRRTDVAVIEAQGDYVRLHTVDGGGHLVRERLSALAESWADAGFAQVHRSQVINLALVEQVRLDAGRCSVTVAGREVQVARRHVRALRELLQTARP